MPTLAFGIIGLFYDTEHAARLAVGGLQAYFTSTGPKQGTAAVSTAPDGSYCVELSFRWQGSRTRAHMAFDAKIPGVEPQEFRKVLWSSIVWSPFPPAALQWGTRLQEAPRQYPAGSS